MEQQPRIRLSRRGFLQVSGLAAGLALTTCATAPPAETGDEGTMAEPTGVVI